VDGGASTAEGFVARMGLESGARVLDIACGTGNVTIPLARRGARVTGLDMMPHLLEEARARADRAGLRIRFDEGFAEGLPYADGSFDVVVSMFGIMFSPLPAIVVAEMARVLTPGGRLEQLWIDNNLATDPENHTLISNEYLKTLATRRGL